MSRKLILLIIFFICGCMTPMQYYTILYEDGQFDKAILALFEEKEKYPEDWKVDYYLGLCYLEKYKIKEDLDFVIRAISALEEAYNKNKKEIVAKKLLKSYDLYSNSLIEKKDYQNAVQYYKKYVEITKQLHGPW